MCLRSRRHSFILASCFWALLTSPACLWANSDIAKAIITKAQTRLVNDVYLLDAITTLSLSESMLNALDNGISLTVSANIKIIRPRMLWFDNIVKDISKQYELKYYDLSERYILTDLKTGEKKQFRTHTSALTALGDIQDYPLISLGALDKNARYAGELSYSLHINKLPTPLRLKAYLFKDWHLTGETYRWRLQ